MDTEIFMAIQDSKFFKIGKGFFFREGKMDKEILRAVQDSRVFKIGSSFFFAIQIPDDSAGISGSRCSNCNSKTVYCNQICRHCNLPFIGPLGFPQLPDWEALSSGEKRTMAEKIYCRRNNRGRLVYLNVKNIPLISGELDEVERLDDRYADHFFSTHGVEPQKIREILLT